MRTIFVMASVAMLLSGCVTPSVYQWGNYDSGLYASYKDPTQVEQLRIKLETLIAEQEKNKQKVAPGLYAELGTLYLQAGASDKAVAMYTRERDAWPESKGLMDAMIKNVGRPKQARLEVKPQ
ncbi:MAG TPA: DUF4810 domain-containing protein [Rhodocyclaceae bacterium]|jgi:hypothetical protein|nr:DUF4810 domain-containing protein [Rhodocyclaceae bacterium]